MTDTVRRLSSDVRAKLSSKPGTPEVAVKVFVTLLIKDLSDLDIIHGTFYIMMGVKLHWIDERMIGYDGDVPRNLWCPMFALPNALDVADEELFEGARGVMIMNPSTGLLSFQKNISARFLSNFDIREFPFDEYSMDVRFNSSCLRDGRDATTFGQGCRTRGAQFHLLPGINPDDCPGAPSRQAFIIRDKSVGMHLPEHTVMGVHQFDYVKPGANTCSFISWGVCVRRVAHYYFFKVVMLLWLTTGFAFSAFFFPIYDVDERVNIVCTVFIACVATLYVIDEALPRCAFLHRIDKLVMLTTIMLFSICVESCAVYQYSKAQDKQLGARQARLWVHSCVASSNSPAGGASVCTKTAPNAPIEIPVTLASLRAGNWMADMDVWFGYAAFTLYVLFNLQFFGPSLYRLKMRLPEARPDWLPEHKTYTPIDKVFAIDIWADMVKKKQASKQPTQS